MSIFKSIKRGLKRRLKKSLNIILSPDEPFNEKLSGANINGEFKDKIKLGYNVKFGGNVYIHADGLIEIGENSIIGYGAILHTSTHDVNSNPVWTYRIDKPIKIGRDVWVGTGVIILPGVIVEDYAIVGAGSVVTANVPKGAIVAGNPARIIRYREVSVLKENNIISMDDAIIKKGNYQTKKVIKK